MGVYQHMGANANPIPPDSPTFVPSPPPDIAPGRAADANDDGALWWDHDDDASPGTNGFDGAVGQAGQVGNPGGDTALGAIVTIAKAITGTFIVQCAGGFGQPGGPGGRGGKGGRGQDGGHGADEHPAAAAGKGGRGGDGGVGGKGGGGGNIFQLDITIGNGVDGSLVSVSYTQGRGGDPGPGGDPGDGGDPGNDGNGNPGQRGFQGTHGPFGEHGKNGIVTPVHFIAG